MKKTYLLASALFAGCALNASAATILQQWQWEGTAGQNINAAPNTGTLGSTWNSASTTEFTTDGSGNLDVMHGTGGYKPSSAAPALSGTDTFSLEIKIAEWNIPVINTVQAKLQFRMNANPNVVEIQTLLDPTNGLGFTFVSGGTNYRTQWVGGASGTDVTARVDFNLGATPGTGTAKYYIDDVEQNTFSGLTFNPMVSFLMQKGGFDNAGVDAATVLKIGEQTLSVVPEPSSAALLGLGGLALILRRRK